MRAEAIVCDAEQQVALVDVKLPEPGPLDVVVETSYSGISNGTERNLLRGELSWGPFPICPGYQAVGVVESVGTEVTSLERGDEVFYRENRIERTVDGRPLSSVRGTHCSKAVVNVEEHVIGELPFHTLRGPASQFALASIALNGVEMAAVDQSDVVLVQGVGMVGLGVIGWAAERGATVIAVDPVTDRLEVAERLGAMEVVDPQTRDVGTVVADVSGGGADVVVEATGNQNLVERAMSWCAHGGRFVFMSDYGDTDLSFDFRIPHTKQLTVFFPCGDGGEDCLRRTVEGIAKADINWGMVIDTELTPAEAPSFYDVLVSDDTTVSQGATIHWM